MGAAGSSGLEPVSSGRSGNTSTLFRGLWRSIDRNNLLGLSAELAYSFLFGLFPFLICVIALAPFLPVGGLVDKLLAESKPFVPGAIFDLIEHNVRALTVERHGWLLLAALLLSSWSASGATVTLISGLNAIYGVQERRSIWKTRGLSMFLALGGGILVLLAVAILMAGGAAGAWLSVRLGAPDLYSQSWTLLRWPAAALVLFVVVTVHNLFCPSVELRLREVVLGSAVSATLWILATLIFSWYSGHLANFNATYGSLGSAMLLLTWLYVNGFVLLFGGQINALIYPKGRTASQE